MDSISLTRVTMAIIYPRTKKVVVLAREVEETFVPSRSTNDVNRARRFPSTFALISSDDPVLGSFFFKKEDTTGLCIK